MSGRIDAITSALPEGQINQFHDQMRRCLNACIADGVAQGLTSAVFPDLHMGVVSPWFGVGRAGGGLLELIAQSAVQNESSLIQLVCWLLHAGTGSNVVDSGAWRFRIESVPAHQVGSLPFSKDTLWWCAGKTNSKSGDVDLQVDSSLSVCVHQNPDPVVVLPSSACLHPLLFGVTSRKDNSDADEKTEFHCFNSIVTENGSTSQLRVGCDAVLQCIRSIGGASTDVSSTNMIKDHNQSRSVPRDAPRDERMLRSVMETFYQSTFKEANGQFLCLRLERVTSDMQTSTQMHVLPSLQSEGVRWLRPQSLTGKRLAQLESLRQSSRHTSDLLDISQLWNSATYGACGWHQFRRTHGRTHGRTHTSNQATSCLSLLHTLSSTQSLGPKEQRLALCVLLYVLRTAVLPKSATASTMLASVIPSDLFSFISCKVTLSTSHVLQQLRRALGRCQLRRESALTLIEGTKQHWSTICLNTFLLLCKAYLRYLDRYRQEGHYSVGLLKKAMPLLWLGTVFRLLSKLFARSTVKVQKNVRKTCKLAQKQLLRCVVGGLGRWGILPSGKGWKQQCRVCGVNVSRSMKIEWHILKSEWKNLNTLGDNVGSHGVYSRGVGMLCRVDVGAVKEWRGSTDIYNEVVSRDMGQIDEKDEKPVCTLSNVVPTTEASGTSGTSTMNDIVDLVNLDNTDNTDNTDDQINSLLSQFEMQTEVSDNTPDSTMKTTVSTTINTTGDQPAGPYLANDTTTGQLRALCSVPLYIDQLIPYLDQSHSHSSGIQSTTSFSAEPMDCLPNPYASQTHPSATHQRQARILTLTSIHAAFQQSTNQGFFISHAHHVLCAAVTAAAFYDGVAVLVHQLLRTADDKVLTWMQRYDQHEHKHVSEHASHKCSAEFIDRRVAHYAANPAARKEVHPVATSLLLSRRGLTTQHLQNIYTAVAANAVLYSTGLPSRVPSRLVPRATDYMKANRETDFGIALFPDLCTEAQHGQAALRMLQPTCTVRYSGESNELIMHIQSIPATGLIGLTGFTPVVLPRAFTTFRQHSLQLCSLFPSFQLKTHKVDNGDNQDNQDNATYVETIYNDTPRFSYICPTLNEVEYCDLLLWFGDQMKLNKKSVLLDDWLETSQKMLSQDLQSSDDIGCEFCNAARSNSRRSLYHNTTYGHLHSNSGLKQRHERDRDRSLRDAKTKTATVEGEIMSITRDHLQDYRNELATESDDIMMRLEWSGESSSVEGQYVCDECGRTKTLASVLQDLRFIATESKDISAQLEDMLLSVMQLTFSDVGSHPLELGVSDNVGSNSDANTTNNIDNNDVQISVFHPQTSAELVTLLEELPLWMFVDVSPVLAARAGAVPNAAGKIDGKSVRVLADSFSRLVASVRMIEGLMLAGVASAALPATLKAKLGSLAAIATKADDQLDHCNYFAGEAHFMLLPLHSLVAIAMHAKGTQHEALTSAEYVLDLQTKRRTFSIHTGLLLASIQAARAQILQAVDHATFVLDHADLKASTRPQTLLQFISLRELAPKIFSTDSQNIVQQLQNAGIATQ